MSPIPDLLDTLQALAKRLGDPHETEADTRARLVDPLLEALGWPPEEVRREPYDSWIPEPGFLDYLLLVHGQPYIALEAKKSPEVFAIPERLASGGATTLARLQKTASGVLTGAIQQAIRYATHCGAPYACATNGHQYAFLKPSHRHRPLAEAKVVMFQGFEAIVSRLTEFERLLGRDYVAAGSPEEILIGRERQAASFAQRLHDTHTGASSATLESRQFAELADYIIRNFLIEIPDEEAFHRCYVQVGWTPTTDDAVLALLENQARSLALPTTDVVQADEILPAKPLDKLGGTPRGRSIVFHGPIGIGKSSYLRHLFKRMADSPGNTSKSIWVRLDLLGYRFRPFTPDSVDGVLSDLGSLLRTQVADAAARLGQNADPEEWAHLRDIYNREASRFHKERYPESDDTDRVFIEALRDYIFKLKEQDAREHLVRTVEWLTQQCRVPVVIALDNSDQLGLQFQEYLYDLAALLDQRSHAVTMICLRTEALLSHRIRDNALARIEERYEISRPPLVSVLSARLEEVERVLRPRMAAQRDPNYNVAFDRIWALLLALRNDCSRRGPASRLVEIAGNGNLRRTLQAVGRVFKGSPKLMDTLVKETAHDERFSKLDRSFVLRGILRGSSGRYESGSKENLIPNLFAVDKGIREPHTLSVYVLRHVLLLQRSDAPPAVSDVINELAAAGIDPELVRKLIASLRRGELLVTSHMFEELANDDRLRTSPLGEGILSEILAESEYYDAVVWDTIIYERDVFNRMTRTLRELAGRKQQEEIRGVFIEYLEAADAGFRAAHSLELLPPEAWGTPPGFPQSTRTSRQGSIPGTR
jgi:hypothetical protein